MADEQNPQQPSQGPVNAPQPLQPSAAVTMATAATTVVDNSIKGLWARYGIVFLVVGTLILVAKFGNIIIDLLGWSSKKDLEKAQETDTELKAQADAANQQADVLVKKANELPNQETAVNENWDKK